MTVSGRSQSGSGVERLAKARASQARDEIARQAKAVRMVDDHATDTEDRAMLIAMLGLDAAASADTGPRYVGPLT